MSVNGVGHAAKMRNDSIVRRTEIAPRQHGRLMHRHRLDDNHRRAAHGALGIVSDMARTWDPSSAMLAVCAPKTMRLRKVLCPSFTGSNRWKQLRHWQPPAGRTRQPGGLSGIGWRAAQIGRALGSSGIRPLQAMPSEIHLEGLGGCRNP
jgi:hypothetical protein